MAGMREVPISTNRCTFAIGIASTIANRFHPFVFAGLVNVARVHEAFHSNTHKSVEVIYESHFLYVFFHTNGLSILVIVS